MRKRLFILSALLFAGIAAFAQSHYEFENPPKEARPYVWWHWINGNTSKDGIRKDLEWMHSIGIAGFHQFDAGGAMLQSMSPTSLCTMEKAPMWSQSIGRASRKSPTAIPTTSAARTPC